MPSFPTIPRGTHVTWHYRSAIGHGVVQSIAKLGTTSANTLYNIREQDHHVSATGSREKPIVQHYGSALTRASGKYQNAGNAALRKARH